MKYKYSSHSVRASERSNVNMLERDVWSDMSENVPLPPLAKQITHEKYLLNSTAVVVIRTTVEKKKKWNEKNAVRSFS